MTREIKFRIWNNGQMRYSMDGWSEDTDILNLSDLFTETILMQYTGLKDKNNKEIYEGDLLKMDYHGDTIFEVVFDNGAFCIKPFMSPDTLVDDYTDQATIVGNIYRNPEMLK